MVTLPGTRFCFRFFYFIDHPYMLRSLRLLAAALVLATACCTTLAAQESGLKYITEGQFIKAREAFNKSMAKRSAGSHYGYAVLNSTANPANASFSLDSAYTHINQAEEDYAKYEQEERQKLIAMGITFQKVLELHETIMKQAFEAAQKANTVEGYDHFIGYFTRSKDLPAAIKLRNTAAFVVAKGINTPRSYKHFLDTYPNAAEVRDARKLFFVAAFDSVNTVGTPEAYQTYVDKYIDSPQRGQAEDSLYLRFTKLKTVDAYKGFVDGYPRNRNVKNAWRTIYHMSTFDLMAASYQAFLEKFPDYPERSQVRRDLDMAVANYYLACGPSGCGFINPLGALVILPNYPEVRPFSENAAAARQGDKWGFLGKSGAFVVEAKYDKVGDFQGGMAPAALAGKWGLLDKKGDWVVPALYDTIGALQSGFRICRKTGRFGYLKADGTELAPPAHNAVYAFSGDRARVWNDGKYGFIDLAGTLIIPCEYDSAGSFIDGVAVVKNGDKYGLIDRVNTPQLPLEYEYVGIPSEGRALVVKDKKMTYATTDGKKVFPSLGAPKPGDTDLYFVGGLAPFRNKDGKAGLVDTNGKVVLAHNYETLLPVTTNRFMAQNAGLWSLIDKTGKLVSPLAPERIGDEVHGMRWFARGDKYGYADSLFKEAIAPIYDEVMDFNEARLACTKKEGKWGVINKKNEALMPFEVDEIAFVDKHLVRVRKNNRNAFYSLEPGKQKYLWKAIGF